MSIFDAHLLDQGWPTPRCVQVCPTGALAAIHDSDEALRALAAREDLQPLRPDLDTRPRVLYRNLPRIRSVFLSGNVVAALPDGRKNQRRGRDRIAGRRRHRPEVDHRRVRRLQVRRPGARRQRLSASRCARRPRQRGAQRPAARFRASWGDRVAL